ncbi:MAG: A24 family peptidase [Nanoarchaeota archaeon]|nr:A24 family peptidase [Nanoarchaeota archaeon]
MLLTFDIIITAVVVMALTIASLFDIKTREIPDWISYGLLSFVIITRALQSILMKNHAYITYSLMYFAIFFIFGNLMYFTKQWGGGDTKLITSLGTAFAVKPAYISANSIIPFPIIILVNILIVGAIYGTFYAVTLAFRHAKEFKAEFIKLNSEKKIKIMKIFMLAAALLIMILSYASFPSGSKHLGAYLALISLLLPYLIMTLKSVELSCMYKRLKPSALTEGDWVQEDIYKDKKLIYKINQYGIDKKSIEKIKKSRIKSVLVKEGIPFIPSFWLGTIIALYLGKIIFLPLI